MIRVHVARSAQADSGGPSCKVSRMMKAEWPLELRALLRKLSGWPNLVAIARACGFQRNEFYVRPELVRQVDLAYEEEQKRTGIAYVEPIDRLRTYLKNLRATGGQIPLWGANPSCWRLLPRAA